MKSAIERAQEIFLQNISLGDIETALDQLMHRQLDYGDLYFQHQAVESVVLEDTIVKEGSFSIVQGVGIRAIKGESCGLSYADDITKESLYKATNIAQAIAKAGHSQRVPLQTVKNHALYSDHDPLKISFDTKMQLLLKADAYARSLSPHIKNVIASLNTVYEVVLIAATDGTLAADVRPLIRMNVNVIAAKEGLRESASSGAGGRKTFHELFMEHSVEALCEQAVHSVMVNLEAKPAPAGSFPVVLGPGWPGVLLHEAVGHGLEGDFNRRGSSAFSNRIGQMVASELCTVVDDGTLAHRRGSLQVDDEGTPTQRTVLIENGRLKQYMQDKHNARLMGTTSTGNGRRESYAHSVMPRMTNTFMVNGQSTREGILASLDKGVYAVNFGGGSVDITSGQFVFNASEAYWVEKGKICYPIKGATLIGNGPEVMQKIVMVGNDSALDPGIGTCGKSGQSVPVGVGQPTLKIRDMTIGGAQS